MAGTRAAAFAMLVAIGLAGAGCAAPVTEGVSASTASSGAGIYPNLNVPLSPATAQLTREERTTTADELRQRRGGMTPTPAPAANANQLRQIGGRHSADAIRRIEGN